MTVTDVRANADRSAPGPPRSATGPPTATPCCWRTTTSCPRSRTSPTTRATRWRSPGSPPSRRVDDRLLRRALHGRDGQDPRPGQDRAHPGRPRRLLARRLDHRRPAARVEGRAPRRRRGLLRQHDRRGEGRDRRLLHLVQRRRGRGVDPGGPRGAVPARPVPRRARPPDTGPAEHARLGGGVPRARRHQRRRAHRAGRGAPGRRAVRAPRVRLRDLGALPGRHRRRARRAGPDPLHRRDARRRPRVARRRRCWSPPRSACCTSCGGPLRRSTSGR